MKPGGSLPAEREARRAAFLLALADVPNVSRAARHAGLSRTALYDERKRDPDFAEAWDDAIDEAIARLEETAFRWAEDESRPAASSADMLKFLLRAWNERYADQRRTRLQGDIKIVIEHKPMGRLPDGGGPALEAGDGVDVIDGEARQLDGGEAEGQGDGE